MPIFQSQTDWNEHNTQSRTPRQRGTLGFIEVISKFSSTQYTQLSSKSNQNYGLKAKKERKKISKEIHFDDEDVEKMRVMKCYTPNFTLESVEKKSKTHFIRNIQAPSSKPKNNL